MLTFRVTDNFGELVNAIGDIGKRHIPRSAVIALTRTAVQAKDELRQAMALEFVNPVPFTLNSLYVKPATYTEPTATVMLKDQDRNGAILARKYLSPEIAGGSRNHKRFEQALIKAGILPAGWYVMPGSAAPIDGNGNVSGRFYSSILAILQASGNASKDKAKGSSMKAGSRRAGVFALTAQRGKLKPGIYQRFTFAHGSAVKPIFAFVRKPPHYAKRFTFFETIQQTVAQRFPDNFAQAWTEAMERFGA